MYWRKGLYIIYQMLLSVSLFEDLVSSFNFVLSVYTITDSLWSDSSSEISQVSTLCNVSKQQPASMGIHEGGADPGGADHEYHEISDEENQDCPLRLDKALNFDFGPSLLDEMDQMFRSLGETSCFFFIFLLNKIYF